MYLRMAVLVFCVAAPFSFAEDMPVWGPVFWHMSQGHESEMQQRIANLTRYIESLQAK